MGKGSYENLVGLSTYDGTLETVECSRVNTCCMLDRISPQDCRDTLAKHAIGKLVRSAKNEQLVWLTGIK